MACLLPAALSWPLYERGCRCFYTPTSTDHSPALPPCSLQLSAGRFMSAAVTAAGEVWTFGGGFNGELGTGASWSPGARRVEGILAQVGIRSQVVILAVVRLLSACSSRGLLLIYFQFNKLAPLQRC